MARHVLWSIIITHITYTVMVHLYLFSIGPECDQSCAVEYITITRRNIHCVEVHL